MAAKCCKKPGRTAKKAPRFAVGRLVRFHLNQEFGQGLGVRVGEVVELQNPDGPAKVRTGDGRELLVFAADVC